jgi:hypothetical protein
VGGVISLTQFGSDLNAVSDEDDDEEQQRDHVDDGGDS